jgi:hypothetical protein
MKFFLDSTRLLVAGFIGFMLATTGIALLPEIGTPAARLICPVPRAQSRASSTATSSTVTRTFYCPTTGAKDRNITLWVAVVSALLYTAIGYGLGTLLGGMMLLNNKISSR